MSLETEGEIEPATFRFITQHLNHCATAIPVLFGSNGNSHRVRTLSSMCIYTHTLHEIETLVWKKKWGSSGRRASSVRQLLAISDL